MLVHGHLNPDELAAIQDVVDQAAALADKFFSGDVQGAFAAAATEAAGAPAANDASVSTSASVSGTAEPPGPALATHPAAETNAPAETTGAPPAETTDDAAESDAAAKTKDATAATGSPVTGSAAVLATIGAFLHDLLEAFAAPAGQGGVQSCVSLDLSLKIRIFQSFVLAASGPSGSGESSGAAP